MNAQAQAQRFTRLTSPSLAYRYIHLKAISVKFIKRHPTSVLELVFKDHAGVKHRSNNFKRGDLVHWNLNMYVRLYTSAALTIQQAFSNMRVAEISVKFKPNEFRDNSVIGLRDSNHCVTVNFICGRSQSLADVTRILGTQENAALPPMVPRLLKLPQLAGYINLYASILWLNDDILLDIFNCYRLDKENSWNVRLGWRSLSHVCQRWRHLIYESAFHLGLQIQCANGTGLADALDHLPPLPLLLDYSAPTTERDELGIYHTLRLHDRIRKIYLHLPPSILQKCLSLMDNHFPMLERLSLSFEPFKTTTLTLPKAFVAPNLRHLDLPGIGLSGRLQFLIYPVSLITLELTNIQTSSYFRPRLLVARLSPLLQLEKLAIGFSIPIPRPSTERELLGEQGTPITLPNLKSLRFRGVAAYLESLIGQIRAPVLEQLHITLFNQIAFTLPHLSHFINITKGLKPSTVKVSLGHNAVSIITTNSLRWSESDGPFFLQVMCKPLDWQIDCAAQLCSTLLPVLLVPYVRRYVRRLTLDIYSGVMPTNGQYDEIDDTTWHELFRSLIGVQKLHIHGNYLEALARALQVEEVGSDAGFLPDLQDIVAARNLFASFIDTRRVVGRPVQFSPVPAGPKTSIGWCLTQFEVKPSKTASQL